MSFLGLSTTNNLSFYAIPAAWVLAIAPHFYAMALYNKERAPGTPAWSFASPKSNIVNIKSAKLSPSVEDAFLRAESANDNSFVGLPLFAAAIVAGNVARLPVDTLNAAAALYLVSRIAYSVLYVKGTNLLGGLSRTTAWLTASFTCLTLFVKAGNKLYGF
ncbi:hypothetical protein TREMEDRAFT_74881 [Tremella mesenterica DSM 1558]|uniref:uncharacterized protein n=1 Tax=Tremella mesenterica (strain ATCC 24925 / CBS 8224 / DSM 1558 / NBRC 9311 / NRRL Y-6157 / RJB 2259-6 / UBC 559-6) TaxID=578456 RepID=UPI00032D4FBA|nr:uncharacterized protein TREMEDRAFT_74881 [Tremella mesenterica DSM 1558]EIW65917.1 hypothetical protein TREMEDRAFT_74881 [Tremella mesenterica DSM 1558]